MQIASFVQMPSKKKDCQGVLGWGLASIRLEMSMAAAGREKINKWPLVAKVNATR